MRAFVTFGLLCIFVVQVSCKCTTTNDCPITRCAGTQKPICTANQCVCGDPCVPNPCTDNHHGSCKITEVAPYFRCNCNVGFSGELCEQNHHCDSPHCQNGGTCYPSAYRLYFRCQCPYGYLGTYCEIRDNCAKNPCPEGAICRNVMYTPEGYTCECRTDDCTAALAIQECNAHIQCQHGGTCVQTTDTRFHVQYSCQCTDGYYGDTCESHRCDVNPCGAHGQCVQTFVGPFYYRCQCEPGWHGSNSSNCLVNACVTNACHEHGVCVPTTYSLYHYCINCTQGYTGIDCQTARQQPVSACTSNPCNYGRLCVATLQSPFYECQCHHPGTGYNCDHDMQCDNLPCQNGGRCAVNANNMVYCQCPAGLTGDRCQYNHCHSNPCQFNGTCQISPNPPNFYTCACIPGHSGANCQDSACTSDPCKNDGKCQMNLSVPPYYTCHCKNGLTGPTCEGSPCQLDTCLHGGACHLLSHAPFFMCTCAAGYNGTHCEVHACITETCANGGTCHVTSQAPFYSCTCPPEYLGGHCGKNHCYSAPCQNGGLCGMTSQPPYFTCACPAAYSGAQCEYDHCHTGPCMNKGTCQMTSQPPYYFSCACAIGFTGRICEVGVCQNNPCQHNGTCHEVSSPPYYTCACAPGREGVNCENFNYCLQCDEAVSPYTCDQVTKCGSHESCFIDAFANSLGGIRYTLGCRDSKQCGVSGKRAVPLLGSSLVLLDRTMMAARASNITCSQCCVGRLCNSGGCGVTPYQDLNLDTRGPLCFSCAQQSQIDDCDTIQICGRDQICQLKRTSIGGINLWTSSCIDEQVCTAELMNHLSIGLIGRKRNVNITSAGNPCSASCCRSDLCNLVCPDG